VPQAAFEGNHLMMAPADLAPPTSPSTRNQRSKRGLK
jgi:hypothetical protein